MDGGVCRRLVIGSLAKLSADFGSIEPLVSPIKYLEKSAVTESGPRVDILTESSSQLSVGVLVEKAELRKCTERPDFLSLKGKNGGWQNVLSVNCALRVFATGFG
jgi:hypothetical protein